MTASDHGVRREAIDPTRALCQCARGLENRAAHATTVGTAGASGRPEQVLAITFTRKAASEMALRVMEKLEQARENVPVTAEHERQTRALALAVIDHAGHKQWRLDDTTLNIRTIDSFCMAHAADANIERYRRTGRAGRQRAAAL